MESRHSIIEQKMAAFQKKAEQKNLYLAASPFSEKEMTESKRKTRVQNGVSFDDFDATYFPPEMYSDGYYKPSLFHKQLAKLCSIPGVHIVAGPRKHGKSATAKKVLIQRLLYGFTTFALTASESLDTASEILEDIIYMMRDNPRIMYDFKPEIVKADSGFEFSFYIPGQPGIRSIKIFSAYKSPKGKSKGLNRPQFILFDDLETRTSPRGRKHSEKRVELIAEAYGSLSENGILVGLGNNFREECYIELLRQQAEDATIQNGWSVHLFSAWSNNKPLWKEKYPAKTETQLRTMLKVKDDSEWMGDYLQQPVPPDGFTFLRPHHEYDELPNDAKGVIWADPNLSLKDRGDTTAIAVYLYSPRTGEFYMPDVRCKSFSSASDLITAYYEMYQRYKPYIYAQGWDGNVNQEATWTNFVRDWCRIHQCPFPQIVYKRYNVDLIAKNASAAWNEGRIKIRKGLIDTKEGKEFFRQVFSFTSKRENKKDDAPDLLVSSHEFIHERGFGRRAVSGSKDSLDIMIFDNYISF